MEQSIECSDLAKKTEKRRRVLFMHWAEPWRMPAVAEVQNSGGFFFFNLIHSYRPKLLYQPVFSEMSQNGQNRTGMVRILTWGGTEGVSYRFAHWYEIFRPFRPERNGFLNYDLKSKVCFQITINNASS